MSATTAPPPSTAPTGSSWTTRAIDLTITLGQGTFGGGGFNTVKLSNLRIVATIDKAGFPSADSAHIRAYGVDPSVMNQISTLGINTTSQRQNNTVTLEAGDPINGMSLVYSGYIQNAYQSFDDAPETSLNIDGLGGNLSALQPVPPISFPGSADVATIMSGIANRAGWGFENGGVQTQIANQYLSGTATQQYQDLARNAGIQAYLDTGRAPNTLAIWPSNGARSGAIPVISKATGMIGYPKFRDKYMAFRTLFNPNIRIGGKIQMQSTVGQAAQFAQSASPGINVGGPNGIWNVSGPVSYDLASQMPGGPWFTDVVVSLSPGAPVAGS